MNCCDSIGFLPGHLDCPGSLRLAPPDFCRPKPPKNSFRFRLTWSNWSKWVLLMMRIPFLKSLKASILPPAPHGGALARVIRGKFQLLQHKHEKNTEKNTGRQIIAWIFQFGEVEHHNPFFVGLIFFSTAERGEWSEWCVVLDYSTWGETWSNWTLTFGC